MKFINLTRRTEIGANCYYLEGGGARLLLDSGMHPRETGEDALPNWNALKARAVDAILVTHAHQDHIGTLPALMRRQPTARVFMTEATGEIGSALLHNSVNVMTRQRLELTLPLYPLFTHRETERARDRWHFRQYQQRYTVAGERAARDAAELTFELWDAGHVLGSAGILLRAEGRSIFYTGDVNFDDQTIARRAVFPQKDVDILIMECTRGDNAQPPGWTRAREEERLLTAIETTFQRGGCVLIPVFALGKTQEVLGMVHRFRQHDHLPEFPIYIGGLSSKMTAIYDRRSNQTRRHLPRLQLLPEVAPFVLNGQTVAHTPARAGRVYALSSGMMTPKTLSNVFARRVLEDRRSSILFVGYADPASPAGALRTAQPGQSISLDPEQPAQTLRCDLETFQFSAHASRESLVEYAVKLSPQKIILVHGDVPAVEWMRTQLAARMPTTELVVPAPGQEIEL